VRGRGRDQQPGAEERTVEEEAEEEYQTQGRTTAQERMARSSPGAQQPRITTRTQSQEQPGAEEQTVVEEADEEQNKTTNDTTSSKGAQQAKAQGTTARNNDNNTQSQSPSERRTWKSLSTAARRRTQFETKATSAICRVGLWAPVAPALNGSPLGCFWRQGRMI
jgi:hypothetical protein